MSAEEILKSVSTVINASHNVEVVYENTGISVNEINPAQVSSKENQLVSKNVTEHMVGDMVPEKITAINCSLSQNKNEAVVNEVTSSGDTEVITNLEVKAGASHQSLMVAVVESVFDRSPNYSESKVDVSVKTNSIFLPLKSKINEVDISERMKNIPFEIVVESTEVNISALVQTLKEVTKSPNELAESHLRIGRPPKSSTYSKICQLKKTPTYRSLMKPHTLKCPQCSYTATFKDDYDRHLRKLHNLSTYVCPHCRLALSDKYKLKRHLDKKRCKVHSKAPATHTVPEFTQMTKKLGRDSIVPSGEKSLITSAPSVILNTMSFQCNFCDKSCATYIDIIQHVSQHECLSPGICKFCGAWFPNKYKLRRHLTSSVHDDIPDEQMQQFKIQLESMKIFYPSDAQKNIMCSKEGLHICMQCEQTFPDRFLLSKHKKTKHGKRSRSVKLLVCKFCPASFYRQSEYTEHLNTSHNVSAYHSSLIVRQCPVCCRQFQHHSNVLRHQITLHIAQRQLPALVTMSQLTDNEICNGDVLEYGGNNSSGKSNESSNFPTSYICFVCCQMFDNQTEYKEHIEFHRVWIAHPELGSVPADLLMPSLLALPINKITDTSPSSSISENVFSIDCSTFQETDYCTSVDSMAQSRPLRVETTPCTWVRENSVTCNNQHELTSSQKVITDTVLSISSFACPYCKQGFINLDTLYQHKIDEHRLVAVFRCIVQTCKQIFDSASAYKNHSKIHAQKAFICRTCNEHFDTIDIIMSHRSTAHKHCSALVSPGKNERISPKKEDIKPPLVSSKSALFAKANRRLQMCIRSPPRVKSKIILCDQCGDTFATKVELCRHRVVHAMKRNCKCKICGRLFNKNEHLQRHLVSRHSSAKPHICTHTGCEKAFKRKDKLVEHSKCHTGIKRYSCLICGRKYRYREGLLYHEKTHEKDQQFRCAQCAIPFVRSSELKRHMALEHGIHDKKELYAYHCQICGQSFPRPERLKRHVERDHSVMASWNHRCEHCNKGFPGSKSYKTHMERNHNGQESGKNSAGVRLTRQRKSKLSQIHPVANITVPLENVVVENLNLVHWNDDQSLSQVPDPEDNNESSENEEQSSDADNVSSYEDAYYTTSLDKDNQNEYQSAGVRSTGLVSQYAQPASCVSAATPLTHHLRPTVPYDVRRPTSQNFCSTTYASHAHQNSDESHYATMSDLEMDIVESDRMSPATFALPNATAPASYSYSSYPNSNINQSTSSFYPSLGFYHSGYGTQRNGASGFQSENNGDVASVVVSAPSFSFTRAHTFAPADDRAVAKQTDSNLPNLPVQMFVSNDHASAPFRPVAMPTTQNPTTNPYATSGHTYASQASHIGRWFGNMSLLNPLDGKQSMLDAVHFSRLPPERARTFGMARRDPYMSSYAPSERRMFDGCAAVQPCAVAEQRSTLMDYNFTTADNHSRTMSVARRDDHFAATHAGSSLHQIPSHVPGSMTAMHMPLPLLPPPPPAPHQQQQFPVGDYQWPTMPSMYNWL